MKYGIRMMRYAVAVALLSVAPAAFAAQTAEMTLTGVGDNGYLGGVYIGPYVANINGVSTQVICDDFASDTYVGESWTANVYSFVDLNSVLGSTRFGLQADALAKYQQAAWLTLQLLNPPPASACGGSNCAGQIQFAIWQLFDNSAPYPTDYLSSFDRSWVNTYWLPQAAANYASGDYSNFYIYTPVAGTEYGCPSGSCAGAPQEFLAIQTPEPAALAMIGFDLATVGGLMLLWRIRRARRLEAPKA